MSIDGGGLSDDVLDMFAALDEADAPARAELARLEAQMARGVFLTSAEGFADWAQVYLQDEQTRRREVWRFIDGCQLHLVHVQPTEDYKAHRLRFAWMDTDTPPMVWGGFVLYLIALGHNKTLVKGALYEGDESAFHHYRDLMAKAAEDLPHDDEVRLPELEAKPETLAQAAPDDAGQRRPRGANGDTMDRVREVRELIESGEGKTQACKRVGMDTRTYDKYVENIIEWSDFDE